MEKCDYSIIVQTYNAQDTVLYTLESLKYQIETYGNDYRIQVILNDDCSQDKTRQYIDKWIDVNGGLFADIVKNYGERNVGTCKSIVSAWKKVNSPCCYSISGDDIFSANSVFEAMDITKYNDVVISNCFFWRKQQIVDDYRIYSDNLSGYFYGARELKWFTKFECPIQNGSLLSRRCFSDEVFNYIASFNLIEDRPLWYFLLHNRNNITIGHCEKPILIYRLNDDSVCHTGDSKIRTMYDDDLAHLQSDVCKNEHLLVNRLTCDLKKHGIRVNPDSIYHSIVLMRIASKKKRRYKNDIQSQIEVMNRHVKMIENRTEHFSRQIEVSP